MLAFKILNMKYARVLASLVTMLIVALVFWARNQVNSIKGRHHNMRLEFLRSAVIHQQILGRSI